MEKSAKIPITISKAEMVAWLKDHVIHIMVLINGIILTFAMFWTVQLFVAQLLNDDYKQMGASTQQTVDARLSDFESTMQDFTTAFKTYSLTVDGRYVPSPITSSINQRLFDSILWIPLLDPGSSVNLKEGAATDNILDERAVNTAIALSILKQAKNEKANFMYVGPTTKSSMQDNESVTQTRPFAVVIPIINANKQVLGYIAGFSSLDKILGRGDIVSSKYVAKTVFWESVTNAVMFRFESGDDDFLGNGNELQFNFEAKIANKTLKVQVVYKKSSNQFLEYMPWLVGAFGIIITTIVWFYVSNNFKKSRILSRVNSDLAEKNDELNDQIRERERLFQILRKSERENHAIINAISDVIFEVSPSGEIMFLNEAWTRITGFDLETSMGKNLFEMISPSDKDEQRQNIALLAKGQKTAYRALTRLRTIEGTYRSVEIVVSMLRQDDAKRLRVVGSFTDIEERQRAEKALNDAEEKYKTIWENAAGGIYQLTPQGKFLSANPALARIFGYSTTDDLIKSVTNAHEELFLDPVARMQFLKNSVGHSRDATFYETQAFRRNGEKIWVRENFRAVLDPMSNVMYYEGSIEDITQRKENEVQLREAKVHSDMASRAKSEFLANISHELRTPLNSIIGFSEIIRNEVFGPIEPKSYTEYAANIHDSGKHLLGIINQILDISRIDAGERELNESLVDIRKIATICLDLTRTKIGQNSLQVIDTIPDNLPKIVAEEVAVKQMLLNLLSNAAKFTGHGGRITLSAEIESSGNLRVSVTDTGIGLTAEQIEKTTMPFGLVDGRLDKGTGGAGLGLSLVHSLLRLHGGKLDIVSQKGIGTTASLIFPAARVQS